MTTNLTIVINRLRAYLGDFAEEYIALELSLVNKGYVAIEYRKDGIVMTFPNTVPHIATHDLRTLLQNIRFSLDIILGPHHANKCIEYIQYDLFLELGIETFDTLEPATLDIFSIDV